MALLASIGTAPLAASAEAQEAKRVAVLSFSGPQGPRARAIVTSAVGQNAETVPEGELDDARRQVGGELSTGANRVNFASLVSADAIVDGSIRRERRRWVLVVLVYSGDSGDSLGRAVFPMRNLGGLAGVGGSVWGRIGELVQASNRPAGSGGASAQASSGAAVAGWGASDGGSGGDTSTQRGWTPSAAVGGQQQGWSASAGDGTAQTSDTTAIDDAPTPPPQAAPALSDAVETPEDPVEPAAAATGKATLLDFEGDVSLLNRTYSLPVGAEERPRRYSGGGPDMGLLVRAYFLALGGVRGTVSSFHVYATYRRHLSLETHGFGPPPESRAVEAATGESQFELGVALPFRFSAGAEAASLGPYLGYGSFEFSLDHADMQDFEVTSRLATMSYGYLVAGAQLYVPLSAPYFVGRLAGGYRNVFGVGAEAEQAFGPETAGGSGFVLGGGLGGDLPFVAKGLYWMLRAEYFTFVAEFEGDGYQFGEGGRSEDAYWRAGGLLGWRLEG